jgi:transcriptional regulator with XRE-family HTH domain
LLIALTMAKKRKGTRGTMPPPETDLTPRHFAKKFGTRVREMRTARNMTQDALAEASGLSVDGIRRIERAGFSPSLNTVLRLCSGLHVDPSTLFASLESARRDDVREFCDMLAGRSAAEIRVARRVLSALFAAEG